MHTGSLFGSFLLIPRVFNPLAGNDSALSLVCGDNKTLTPAEVKGGRVQDAVFLEPPSVQPVVLCCVHDDGCCYNWEYVEQQPCLRIKSSAC